MRVIGDHGQKYCTRFRAVLLQAAIRGPGFEPPAAVATGCIHLRGYSIAPRHGEKPDFTGLFGITADLAERGPPRPTGRRAHSRKKPRHAVVSAQVDIQALLVLPITTEVQRAGAHALQLIADSQNARGVATPKGRRWHHNSVRDVRRRQAACFSAAFSIERAFILLI
jgi:hypothetical protein